MPDLVGQTLQGRYRILDLLGRGGMADVYKAWDAFRQYHVAVKVMREDLAEDPEFVQRFRREATALSQLAHESIVRFYSFEQADLLAFIVMDYIEGSTLRTEIARAKGPLPLPTVLSVTGQVSAALHYAHMMGILHRDVKPGNVMLQADGRALLSDFGIAKVTDTATATAVVPGTPAYMSPEHCLSQPLDARADVYSLGVVVYEMLAGRKPFVGDSAEAGTGTTAERIRREQLSATAPPLRLYNPTVPPAAEAAVMRALAKERDKRWPSALAFWAALRDAAGPEAAEASRKAAAPTAGQAGGSAAPAASTPRRGPAAAAAPATSAIGAGPAAGGRRSSLMPLIIGGVAVVAIALAVACAAVYLSRRPRGEASPTPPGVATQIAGEIGGADVANTPTASSSPAVPTAVAQQPTPPPLTTVLPGLEPITAANAGLVEIVRESAAHEQWLLGLAYSPDGALLASTARGALRIWRLADMKLQLALPLEQLNGDGGIEFSPDGSLLAAGCGDKTVRIWSLADGSLVSTFTGHGDTVTSVDFSPDGAFLVSSSTDHTVRLWRVADGATVAVLQGSVATVFDAAFASTGRSVLGAGGSAVMVWDVAQPSQPRVLSEGELADAVAFSRDGTLAAVGLYGGSIQVWSTADWTLKTTLTGHEKFVSSLAFSPDGSLLVSGSGDATIRLWDVASGATLKVLPADDARPIWGLAFSPDGTTIASGMGSGGLRLWGVRTGMAQLLPTPTPAGATGAALVGPRVAAAGTIVWSHSESNVWNVRAMASDGSGKRSLTDDDPPDRTPAWSPDGTRLAFTSIRPDRPGNAVYVMNADGSSLTFVVPGVAPSWSPDGTRLAYSSILDGNWDVYVVNIDGSGETRLTTDPNTDDNPDWSPDGSRIAFESNRDGNVEIYVMNVDGSGQTNVTQSAEDDRDPAWSPDGNLIAFSTDRNPTMLDLRIWVMDANGRDLRSVSPDEPGVSDREPDWSPDGSRIVFASLFDNDSWDICVVGADGSGLVRLTDDAAWDGEPSWSPR